jgi:hypothetical protein
MTHGFNTNDKISDYMLLALDKEVVSMMMHKLTYIDYIKWKLNKLNKVLAERVETNDYSEAAVSRINFTRRSIKYNEDILNDRATSTTQDN